MSEAINRPKKRISDKERAAVNRALFDSFFRKGLQGMSQALRSGKVPTEVVYKDGKKKSIDKVRMTTIIQDLIKHQDAARKKFDELRREGIRRRRDAFGPNPRHRAKEESNGNDIKEDAKVNEVKVEETKTEEVKAETTGEQK